MTFEPGKILPTLLKLADRQALVVALSGGLDSVVLLHALCRLRDEGQLLLPVRALHINHGLSPNADRWQEFCEHFCQQHGVEFTALVVRVDRQPGDSLEESAREARYQAFEEYLQPRDCLVMAHHLDDEMETLAMRLTRGAGPAGLAGIPRLRTLGHAVLLRPLLDSQRSSLLEYAQDQHLKWVDDESNTDIGFDRNFWRHEILPLIGKRFPGYRESWRKSMALCRESDQLQQELAASDLTLLAGEDPRILNIEKLSGYSAPRQRNVLRYWMVKQGFQSPGWQLLQRLTGEILTSGKSGACLECANGSVRRFGNQLVLLNLYAESAIAAPESPWNTREPEFSLVNNGLLKVKKFASVSEQQARHRLRSGCEPLTVRYREKGDFCRLADRPGRSLKKVLQDSDLPPWLRSRQPLLCFNGEIVAIPGIGVCEGFQAQPGQAGLQFSWSPPDLLFSSE